MAISAQKKTQRSKKKTVDNYLLKKEHLEEVLVRTGMITGEDCEKSWILLIRKALLLSRSSLKRASFPVET